MNLLNQYESQLDPRVFDLATEEIENAKQENNESNGEENRDEEKRRAFKKAVQLKNLSGSHEFFF